MAMRRLLAAVAFATWFSSCAAAQDTECGAKGPSPKPSEIKLISWNIAELATAVKVYDRPIRSEDEFKDLRAYRDCNDGDVYALQKSRA
jgi:hypothetical protein